MFTSSFIWVWLIVVLLFVTLLSIATLSPLCTITSPFIIIFWLSFGDSVSFSFSISELSVGSCSFSGSFSGTSVGSIGFTTGGTTGSIGSTGSFGGSVTGSVGSTGSTSG